MGFLRILGGGLLIFFGALLSITIIGAIVGVPMLYAGFKMLRKSQHDLIANAVSDGVAKGMAQAKTAESAPVRKQAKASPKPDLLASLKEKLAAITKAFKAK